MKPLIFSNKKNELKQTESTFKKNRQLNNLVMDKIKEIMLLQNIIKLDDVEYTVKRGKHDFIRYSLPIDFLRYIHKINVSLEDAKERKD